MTILRESPWYQEILQQGMQQGAQRQLLRLLQIKFESVPLDLQARLRELSVEQLEEALAVALAANSIDEFVDRISLS
jgi:predicted transposase YdaD